MSISRPATQTKIICENPKERACDRPALHGRNYRKESFGKGKPSRRATPIQEGVIVQKEMPVISGIRLSVPFIKKGNCKLGSKCAFKHTEKAGSEPKKRTNSVVVVKTLDHTQAEDEITSLPFTAKGDLLHGVSAIPVKSILQNLWKTTARKFRLFRVSERFVKVRKERSHFGSLYNKVDKVVEVRNAPSYEQLEVVQIY